MKKYNPDIFFNSPIRLAQNTKKCPKIYYFCCLLCKIIYAIILILEYHYHRPSWWEVKVLVPKNNLLFLQNFSDMFCSCFYIHKMLTKEKPQQKSIQYYFQRADPPPQIKVWIIYNPIIIKKKIKIKREFTPSCFKNWALVITKEKEKKCPKIYYFCCLLCKIIYAIILILEYHYHRPSWWEVKVLSK
jgi:uncharacterized protein (DUF983 family)